MRLASHLCGSTTSTTLHLHGLIVPTRQPVPALPGQVVGAGRRHDMTDLTGTGGGRRAWRTFAFPVTSVRDGFEHLVDDATMTPGSAGRYVALCGCGVWAAALVCPPGPRCPACTAIRDSVPLGRQRHRRTDQRGVWARLIARLRHPCSAQSESAQLPDLTPATVQRRRAGGDGAESRGTGTSVPGAPGLPR